MAEIKDWDVAAANNNDPSPDGAPEGMAPSGVNDVIRENMAVLARWLGDTNGALTATGTADAQLLAPNRTVTAYARGDVYAFRPVADNTGACTLNVSSLGAKSIKTPIGTDPLAGALDTSSVATVIYDGTNFVLVSGAGSASFTNVDIASTDAGAAIGPVLTLHRDSASPADADVIGGVDFDGEDDGGNQTTYARINAEIADVTDGTEDGDLVLSTMNAGTLAEAARISADGVFVVGRDTSPGIAGETYGSFGAGSGASRVYILAGSSSSANLHFGDTTDPDIGAITYDNATDKMSFETNDSVRAVIDSSGNVGIGTTSPAEKLDVVGNAKVSGETYSVTGTTSVPSATWTTIRSFSATDIEQGMVTVFFGGTTSGLVGAYNKLYDGGASNGNASFINRLDAADVRISGNNLQVYHNTGTTVTASWYCLITRAG